MLGDLTTELIGYKRVEKYRDSRFALFSNSFTFFHVTSEPDDKMEANFEHVLCCTKTTTFFFVFFFWQRDSVASKFKHFYSSPFDLICHSTPPPIFFYPVLHIIRTFLPAAASSPLLACSNCVGQLVSALFLKISDKPGDTRKNPFSWSAGEGRTFRTTVRVMYNILVIDGAG